MEAPMDIGIDAEMGAADGLYHEDDGDASGGGLFTFDSASRAKSVAKILGDGESTAALLSTAGDSENESDNEEGGSENDDESAIDSEDDAAIRLGYLEEDVDEM
jgi:hypothetical protein